MPDDPTPPNVPAGIPPASPVRPKPARVPARVPAPRLPGTYAANFERDMDWRRGVTTLWVIFVLAAGCEAVYAAFYYLRGGVDYPGVLQGVRLCAEGALFVALWLGWGWVRWPLAALNFLHAGWLVIWLIGSHARDPNAPPDAPPPHWGIETVPILATACVYLVSAAYLAFSADVLDFLRHRREQGRGWVVAPLVLMVGAYLLAMFGSEWIFQGWLNFEKASALNAVTTDLRAMSSPWSRPIYESHADPAYLATWYEGDRQHVFDGLSPLGAFQHAGQTRVEGGVRPDATGGGFEVFAIVELGETRFDHGSAQFTMDVKRTLFGPWKLGGFDVEGVKVDGVAPAPTAH